MTEVTNDLGHIHRIHKVILSDQNDNYLLSYLTGNDPGRGDRTVKIPSAKIFCKGYGLSTPFLQFVQPC